MAIEGELDELVIIRDGVDAACLVDALRKKDWYATLEFLEEVKPNIFSADDDQMMPPEDNDTKKSKNIETAAHGDNSTNQIVPQHCCSAQCPSICYQQLQPETYEVVYDSYGPTTGCTIM